MISGRFDDIPSVWLLVTLFILFYFNEGLAFDFWGIRELTYGSVGLGLEKVGLKWPYSWKSHPLGI